MLLCGDKLGFQFFYVMSINLVIKSDVGRSVDRTSPVGHCSESTISDESELNYLVITLF